MQFVGPGSKSLPCYSLDLFFVALSLNFLATLTLEIALSLIIIFWSLVFLLALKGPLGIVVN